MNKSRKAPARVSDAQRLAGIRKTYEKMEPHPWRAYKAEFGWYVVEPRAFWECDTIIARYLDGDTAAFLAGVPENFRFMLGLAEEGLKKRTRRERKPK